MSEGSCTRTTLRPPWTAYFVAITYRHVLDRNMLVMCSGVFSVSGDRPLTDEEAIARKRSEFLAGWTAEKPAGEYVEQIALANVLSVT